MKILIICTGNSCRSQMAEGFLRHFGPELQVFSAGTRPELRVNPFAVAVMQDAGIDISHHYPKNVDLFLEDTWDYVITVCGGANENCPAFNGKVKSRLHLGFDDPAAAMGTESEVMAVYRNTRELIKNAFQELYNTKLKDKSGLRQND